jgi:Flp pilus assembly protein CpaB
VSRRARAIAFGCAALACAGLAASVAGRYRTDLETQLGPLRPVVVARSRVPAREPLRPGDARALLEIRWIPQRFAPLGALAAPEQAIGRAPVEPIPPGGYVLAPELRAPGGRRRGRDPRLGHRRKPVEISVTGAEALAAAGGDPTGRRVDVIVTTEPGPGGGSGRTYVAAGGVVLLAIARSTGGGTGDLSGSVSDSWTATLALTKSQALRLIQAQNFARQVRLIPH